MRKTWFHRAPHTALLAAAILVPLQLAYGDEKAAPTNSPRTLAEATDIQNRVLALLERASPCTVKVDGGSGVVVTKEGHVLTVAHVGRVASRSVRITLPCDEAVKGETLGNNSKVDAGVAQITQEYDGAHVPMGDSDAVKPGDWCVALGYPVSYKAGEPPAVRLGRILAVHPHAIVSDCTIMGGDSGGPLFNLDGEVIGIASRASGSPAMNIFVPVNEFTEAWDRFLAGEDWSGCRHDKEGEHGHAFLGIGPAKGTTRAEIGKVFPGSAAERSGLQKGDVVTAIDGATVASYAEILPVMLRKEPGDEMEIHIRRSDSDLVLTATLGEAEK